MPANYCVAAFIRNASFLGPEPIYLITSRLKRPTDISLQMTNTYWIVHAKATSELPKTATFRD